MNFEEEELDFTYPFALVFAAVVALMLSLLSWLASVVTRVRPPIRYRTTLALSVVLFVVAVSLRWTDWRTILLTKFGLFDLGIMIVFASGGAFLGTIPVRLMARKAPRSGQT